LNEEKNLQYVLPKIPEWVDEIILMDGHSVDQTVKVARKIQPDVRVISQPSTGKGEALKYGVAAAKGNIIVTLDADGTYLSEEIPMFIEAIVNGYDFAKGSRFVGKPPECMTRSRQFGNKVLAFTTNLLFNSRYTDLCSGYYAFRKEIFNDIKPSSNGFELETELFINLAKKKYKVKEISHSYKKRLHGISKTRDFRQGFKDILWIIFLRLRTD
jgi:glycosyltransferase involved in cell wall biosynthesis